MSAQPHEIEKAFASAIANAGLGGTLIPADGKLHRFKVPSDKGHQRTGWAVFYGDGVPHGVAGDWRSGARIDWTPDSAAKLSDEDRAMLRELQRSRKAEREKAQKRAAAKAAALFEHLPPAPAGHPYLLAKKLKPGPCKVTFSGTLVVPVGDIETDQVVSLQYIAADGSKRFLVDGRIAGACCILGNANNSLPMVIAEGFATASSIRSATGWPVLVAFNAGNLAPVAQGVRAKYPEREIIIAADNDATTEGNPGVTKATAAARTVHARLAIPAEAGDFNDMTLTRSKAAVKAQLTEAAFVSRAEEASARGEIKRLAKLDPVDYDVERRAAAKRLGIRVKTLDEEITKVHEGASVVGGLFKPIEPWPDPVDGAALLEELTTLMVRHLVLPAGAADAMALWVLHAHTHATAEISPILALSSPTPECGKTTALSMLGALVPKPLAASNITAAAVFRAVERWRPTLLIDEADTFLKGSDDLRGVLNSGHFRRSAFVIRVAGEGKDLEPVRFATWAPKAIALIGKLPPTLASRSIHIEMRRMAPGETVAPVRLERLDFTEILQQATRWAKDAAGSLRDAEPEVPVALYGRRADNWRHLLAIADAAGGDWPARARRAAESLSTQGSEQTTAIILLEDIKAVFSSLDTDRISSTELADKLADIETRPWGDWSKGMPISVRQLARLLAPFGISPGKIRIDSTTTLQGYKAEAFIDAFSRYLPVDPEHQNKAQKTGGNRSTSSRTSEQSVPDRIDPKPAENSHCSGVPDEMPPEHGSEWDGHSVDPDDWATYADESDFEGSDDPDLHHGGHVDHHHGDGVPFDLDAEMPDFLRRTKPSMEECSD